MQPSQKHSPKNKPRAGLPDAAVIDLVQRQTFRFFWEGAHPLCGLARDRTGLATDPGDHLVSTGASGFAIMAIIVAAERGWITRDEAANRLALILGFLERAPSYHGLFPHYMNGRTGAAIRFGRKDDGSDIVETSFLFQGLLCARQYFNADNPAEKSLRDRITWLWSDAEWNWHARDGRHVLTWHWSPNNGFSLDHEIRGWNECLITYVLPAASPHYASYFQQNVQHTLINYEHWVRNPTRHKGFGPSCWGLTASGDPAGYAAHA